MKVTIENCEFYGGRYSINSVIVPTTRRLFRNERCQFAVPLVTGFAICFALNLPQTKGKTFRFSVIRKRLKGYTPRLNSKREKNENTRIPHIPFEMFLFRANVRDIRKGLNRGEEEERAESPSEMGGWCRRRRGREV